MNNTATTGAQLVRDPTTGKFAKGNRAGGRPHGSKDKLTRVRDLLADHALALDPVAGKRFSASSVSVGLVYVPPRLTRSVASTSG